MYKMALQQKDLLAALRFPRLKMLTMGSEVAGAALHLIRHPGIARWAALSFFLVCPLPFIAPPGT